jgi:predicted phage terminase large subunit-like protein
MIVIAQRLHLKDLHGIIKETEPTISAKEALKILRNGGSIDPNVWVDLNLPAICEDPEQDLLGREVGDVLWPEQRSYDWLMAEKKAMGSYLFNAIYQGNPTERDGDIFKREWFEDPTTRKLTCTIPLSKLPKDLPTLRYWDFGASGDAGDGTSGLLSSWDGNILYFLDLTHGKYTSSKLLRTFPRIAHKDGKRTVIRVEQEPGSGSKILIDKFRRDKELKGYSIRSDKVNKSKKVRAFDLEGLAEDGRIKMVKAQWNEKIVDQLVAFTGEEGGEDDIVDTCTGTARYWLRPKRRIIA